MVRACGVSRSMGCAPRGVLAIWRWWAIRACLGVLASALLISQGCTQVTSDPGRGKHEPARAAFQFIDLNPWGDGSAHFADATLAVTGASCDGWGFGDRDDAFRCFVNGGVWDPCFVKPDNPTAVACLDSLSVDKVRYVVFKGVLAQQDKRLSEPTAVAVQLDNDAICQRSSGAGPSSLPGFPRWAGYCRGGTFGEAAAVWRVDDDGQSLKRTGDQWEVPVEVSEGEVHWIAAALAWRWDRRTFVSSRPNSVRVRLRAPGRREPVAIEVRGCRTSSPVRILTRCQWAGVD